MNIITIFIVVVCDMWINMKKSGGYLLFQEEPRVEGNNNNRVTQVEHSQQVGTWYLYFLHLIIIFFTSYLTISYNLVLIDEEKKRGKGKVR